MSEMDLGLYCNRFALTGEADIRPHLRTMAREAERAGFASFWVMDHFFQLPRHGAIDDPMLEAYTTLGFIAAVTERMQLGAMVIGVTYRHPGVLMKAATTLDALSGGRSALGLGAAWFEREHAGLGIPFPPLAERFERLEETLRIAHQMWRDEQPKPFAGRHYQLPEPLSRPRPVQTPHPPILIGGRGERKTLRLVAQYGDVCNFSIFDHAPDLSAPSGLAEVRHKLDVLRAHCEREGRPYDEIRRTVTGWLPISQEPADGSFTPEQALDVLRAYAALGIDEVMIATSTLFPAGPDETTFRLFREQIVPAAKEIVPAGR
jgi:F420-dependent oxidoreductase-like protein